MTTFDHVMAALSQHRLLLQQDQRLPAVVGIITGEALRTSWWSHPRAQLVFDTLSRLADHPDVLFAKVIDEKVTLVHRTLWPALLSVVTAEADWQMDGLTAEARALLASLGSAPPAVVSKTASKELERRLLAHAREVHTPSGRHETRLEPWAGWAERVSARPLASPDEGQAIVENAASALGAELSTLPWHRKRSKARTLRSAR